MRHQQTSSVIGRVLRFRGMYHVYGLTGVSAVLYFLALNGADILPVHPLVYVFPAAFFPVSAYCSHKHISGAWTIDRWTRITEWAFLPVAFWAGWLSVQMKSFGGIPLIAFYTGSLAFIGSVRKTETAMSWLFVTAGYLAATAPADLRAATNAAALPTVYLLCMVFFLRASQFVRKGIRKTRELLDASRDAQRTIRRDHEKIEAQSRDLQRKNDELSDTIARLRTTQEQLVHSEKMATLGELTAGIAHEIRNPLNFITNFAALGTEMATEARGRLAELDAKNEEAREDLDTALEDIARTNERIVEHGTRANGIVTSMLAHSRARAGEKEAIDVNRLVEEYLNLAFHGIRAHTPDFTVDLERAYDPNAGSVSAVAQDIARVVLNLLNNAFYAVNARRLRAEEGYEPQVRVRTARSDREVTIHIADNGDGIPEDVQKKIFQPFFTTKPTGEGTGLGLSMSYDIVEKGHGGRLTFESTSGEGTEFEIALPVG